MSEPHQFPPAGGNPQGPQAWDGAGLDQPLATQPAALGAAAAQNSASGDQTALNFPPPSAQLAPGLPGGAEQPRYRDAYLPVVDTEYQDFYRTPSWRLWRPLVGILILAILWIVETTVLVAGYFVLSGSAQDWTQGGPVVLDQSSFEITPGVFLINNISLALLIPLSMLVGSWCFGQKPLWLNSVAGNFRWKWLATCMGVLTLIWIVYHLIGFLLDREAYANMQMQPYTWLMIFGILLTTPFQAAGEEYAFRGFINRAAASLVRPDVKFGPIPVGWLLGGTVSSALFMMVHGAFDPWLNLFYFSFGFVACYLAWKTGGLEAPIAMHVVNNLFAEVTLPFVDFSDMFDRSAGTGDWTVLIGIAFTVVGAIIIVKLGERQGVVTKSAPGAIEQGELNPPTQSQTSAPAV